MGPEVPERDAPAAKGDVAAAKKKHGRGGRQADPGQSIFDRTIRMSALGAEVVGTRLLSLLLGGTVYTFSIILAVFLVGWASAAASAHSIARDDATRDSFGSCNTFSGAIAWTPT